ncbi:MAG TPA: hypothetical protein VEU33_03640 [Archangium sp.]|nr:hypothetical protein [Archangium sp.]
MMPKSWYPSTTPPTVQRVTVPVCESCADEFEKAERAFAHPLLMAIDADHLDAVGVAQKYQRSWQFDKASKPSDARHRAGRLRKIEREMKFVLTPTDGRVYPRFVGRTAGGLYVSASPAFNLDPAARKRIAEKFVRGFHFAECDEPLPLAAEIGFFWGNDLPADVRAELAKLPINERLAPGLRHRAWRDGTQAVWLFLLWGQIEFGALVRMPENHSTDG